MKALERIKATLNGKIPDRVPVITFTNIAAGNLGPELTEYIRTHADAQYEYPIPEFLYNEFPCLGIQIQKREETTPDGWTERTWICDGDTFSDSFKWAAGGMYRSYRRHVIDDIDVLERILALPYIEPQENAAFIRCMQAYIAQQEAHNTENEFCCIGINDPLSFLAANASPEDMAIWSITEEDRVDAFLQEITRRQVAYLEYMLQNFPLACIFMIGGPEYGIPPLMSPRCFREYVFKNDQKIIGVLHRYGQKVLLHCHGKIRAFLDQMLEMGADAVHPLEAPGPTGDCAEADVKKAYGDRLCLVGNIQYTSFALSSEEEIEQEVKRLMDLWKPGGRFILSPACPLYHSGEQGNTQKTIRAFIDAGLKYGRYSDTL
jgi:hypothetical protein